MILALIVFPLIAVLLVLALVAVDPNPDRRVYRHVLPAARLMALVAVVAIAAAWAIT